MSLQVHRAQRTDLLADRLGELLAAPLADPFAEEVVVVPARGVERWLTQRLSHRLGTGARGGDGVCAGVRFLNPRSLVALLLGKDAEDPWDPDRLVWPLLEVIDEAVREPWCAALARHLGFGLAGEEGDLRRGRRYSVARRLAGLFASYAVQRPALVADWRTARDTDGAGAALDEDLLWQAELWRRLVTRVDEPPPDVRHAETVRRLRSGDTDLELPPRLSLFGHTRLPVTEVELLGALGARREVHLWLPQASSSLWEELAPLVAGGPVRRVDDPSVQRVGHPLLASLGRDARELQRTLAVVPASERGESQHRTGQFSTGEATGGTLLGWLQHDLHANAEPDVGLRGTRQLRDDDRSVQVHACHGPSRQVDVLREVLLGLLEDDPTLEPRDILVMCPDIEAYAPLVQAGFGLAGVAGAAHPAHQLRVRLADRALTSTNPLLAVAGTLVELAGGRVTATEVLDLASAAPVRRRFGFDDDDLATLATWVDQSAARWGLDAAHRGRYGLDLRANTWDFGLDRLLLGVAMSEEPGDPLATFPDALPVDNMASGDIDLAGRFAEYVDRLRAFVEDTERASTAGEWTLALTTAVGRLADIPARDAWQGAQFDRELARMADVSTGSTDGSGTTRLMLADVRRLLADRVGGRPTRANFRTGTLTVCTMVPMRSVPHRVVCLVGLDDGVFPRSNAVDGDDVLARDPMTGERDLRSEDRQLLLDALLAATENLVVTYTGASEHTGAPRPPAVPLGELLDALDVTTAEPVREKVLVAHPLQPFDARNLVPAALVGDRPFSFDAAALAGAAAARAPRSSPGPLLPEPLPVLPPADVELADLQGFFAHPVRAFLRSRLDVAAPLEAEETHDAIPIDLDGLEKYAVGDRLLHDILSGLDPAAGMLAEQQRGELPPGDLGIRTLHEICEQLQPLVDGGLPLRVGTPHTLDVSVDLGEGRRLTGTVGPLFGNRLVQVRYSRLAAGHRLRAWIDLLALSAAHPDSSWTAHTIGRAKAGAARALAGPLDHRAVEWLRALVDLYDRGLCEPLPLPVKTACAYAEAAFRARHGEPQVDPVREATRAWSTDRFSPAGIPGEDADPAHVRVYGEHAELSCLTGPPRPDEQWNDQRTRLGQYAWHVWGPLLEGAEVVGPL
ncbi:MAG TPA: exodeoxyribonuclease V subunit gamma [Nocardioidaceae bacterium]|nr:exodeoxyribonuclease V subunit gamma [Nocardioidaceae bacterium]